MKVRVLHERGAWARTVPVDPDENGQARGWRSTWHAQGEEIDLRVPKMQPARGDGLPDEVVYRTWPDGARHAVMVEPERVNPRLFQPVELAAEQDAAEAKATLDAAQAKYAAAQQAWKEAESRLGAKAEAATEAAEAPPPAEAPADPKAAPDDLLEGITHKGGRWWWVKVGDEVTRFEGSKEAAQAEYDRLVAGAAV